MPAKKLSAILSKSTFIRGLQCEKSLYLHKKRPFLRDRLSPEQLAKFSRGTDVGVYARDLFPGGVDASPKTHFQMAASVKKTAAFIDAGETVIYEAAFEHAGVMIALDILVKEPDGWKAIEVKSSRAISETYLWDASLQYFVIRGSGLDLKDFSLAYIDEHFVKQGPIKPEKLFILESVLSAVRERQARVAEKAEHLKKVTALKSSPAIPIGLQCHDPYPCDFIGHCWKQVPQGSVFDLRGLSREQKFAYFQSGIIRAADIPERDLDEAIIRQVKSIHLGKEMADKGRLKDFLKLIKHPVLMFSWLDFKPAIPVFEGTRPYQSIPYSLAWKSLEKDDKEAEIASRPCFPDEFTLLRLLKAMGEAKTIMVFGTLPEMDVLERMSGGSSERPGQWKKVLEKAIDLSLPFSDDTLVWPEMEGAENPEEILSSMKKPVIPPSGKIRTRLEAALAIEKLARGASDEPGEEVLRNVDVFHSARLANLSNLYALLEPLSGVDAT